AQPRLYLSSLLPRPPPSPPPLFPYTTLFRSHRAPPRLECADRTRRRPRARPRSPRPPAGGVLGMAQPGAAAAGRRRARQRRLERSEEHTSELQSPDHVVCRLLLENRKWTSVV